MSFDPLEKPNPYEVPPGSGISAARPNPLFIPGIIILLNSLFWALYLVVSLSLMLSPNSPMQGEDLAYVRTASTVSYGLMFLCALTVAAGAVAMMTLKWKWLAWTGCILGMLPVFGPCFGLTIPIAIWVLVILRRPEVSTRFS